MTQSYRIDPETAKAARDFCKANGLILGKFVTRAINNELERHMFHVEPKQDGARQGKTQKDSVRIVYDEGQ